MPFILRIFLAMCAAVIGPGCSTASGAIGSKKADTSVAAVQATDIADAWAAGESAVAVRRMDGQVVVLHDDGRHAMPSVPPDCELEGAGGERLLYRCGAWDEYRIEPGTNRVATTDLRGGGAVPLDVATPVDANSPGGTYTAFVGVGGRWLLLRTTGYHWTVNTYIDWRTGRSLADPPDDDSRKTPDLNSLGLFRPLCRPVRRTPGLAADFGDPLEPATFDRPWVVISHGGAIEIHRCGSLGAVLKLPIGSPVAVGAGRLAWVSAQSPGAISVRVRDPSVRRAATIRYAPAANFEDTKVVALALTRARLSMLVSGLVAGRLSMLVASARLPASIR